MAFCFQCGYLMHDDDIESHECNPLDIPAKGNPRKLLRD